MTGTSNDPDGSESLTFSVPLLDDPSGSGLNVLAPGTTVKLLNDTAGFKQYKVNLGPGTGSDPFQTFTLDATVTATETSNGNSTTATKSITVEPVPLTTTAAGVLQFSIDGGSPFGGAGGGIASTPEFFGLDKGTSFSTGGGTLDPFELSGSVDIKTGFEFDLDIDDGSLDVDLAPVPTTVIASLNADNSLSLTTALQELPFGSTFKVTNPNVKLSGDLIFDLELDFELDVLGENIIDFDLDTKNLGTAVTISKDGVDTDEVDISRIELFNFDGAGAFVFPGPAEVFSVTFNPPSFSTMGFDVSPALGNSISTTGTTSSVLDLALDIDDLIFQSPTTPNPFNINAPTLTVANTGIDLIGDFADLDLVVQTDWRQDFTLNPGTIVADVFVDQFPVLEGIDASAIPDLTMASDLDRDGNNKLDIELKFHHEGATLDNEGFLDIDFGPVLSFLNFGIRGRLGGATIFDNQIGPLFKVDATQDVGSIPIFDTSFDLAFDEYSIVLPSIDLLA